MVQRSGTKRLLISGGEAPGEHTLPLILPHLVKTVWELGHLGQHEKVSWRNSDGASENGHPAGRTSAAESAVDMIAARRSFHLNLVWRERSSPNSS